MVSLYRNYAFFFLRRCHNRCSDFSVLQLVAAVLAWYKGASGELARLS